MADETTTREMSQFPTDQPGSGDMQPTSGLTPEELAQQEASDLPERENMSLVNANVAAPVNLAAALNVLSDNSTAEAAAIQDAPITQGIG
jgi:hypothetical protein